MTPQQIRLIQTDDEIRAILSSEVAAQLRLDNATGLMEWFGEIVDSPTRLGELEGEERRMFLHLALVGLRHAIDWGYERNGGKPLASDEAAD